MTNIKNKLHNLLESYKSLPGEKRKKYRKVGLIAVVIAVLSAVTFTLATPVPVWKDTPSTNCLSQAGGASMVEANDYLYIIPSNGDTFKRYDPSTGTCDATDLAELPVTGRSELSAEVTTMEAVDTNDDGTDDYLYAFLDDSGRTFVYDLGNDEWIRYNTSLANDTNDDTIPYVVHYPTVENVLVGSLNNKIYFGVDGDLLEYDPSTNSWGTPVNTPGNDFRSGAITSMGSLLYVLPSAIGGNNDFYSYDPSTTTWTPLADMTTDIGYGSALTSDGTSIYAFPGASGTLNSWNKNFYKYTGGSWSSLADTPDLVGLGGSLVYPGSGNYVYAFKGNSSTDFWRYNISGDSWDTSLAQAPKKITRGGSLSSDGTDIYATIGNNTKEFWKYSVSGDSWSQLDDTPWEIDSDDALTFIPSGNSGGGEFFVTTGETITGAAAPIYRYPLTGTHANTWPLFKTPPKQYSNFYGEGSAIVHPGVSTEDPTGEFLYYFIGDFDRLFMKYSLTRKTWFPWNRGKTSSGDPIAEQDNRTDGFWQGIESTMVEVDGILYFIQGDGNSTFQKYDPSTNKWTDLPDTPADTGAGASMGKYDNDTIYVLGGNATKNIWIFDIPSEQWITFNTGTDDTGRPYSQDGRTQSSSSGTEITQLGGKFYIITNYQFDRFDPAKNEWTQLLNTAGGGESLVGAQGNIYWLYGSGNGWQFYDVDENTWATLTNLPGTTSAGADIGYSGSGNDIYVTAANNSGNFYKYTISDIDTGAGSWTTMNSAPSNITAGGSLVMVGSYGYALAGGDTKTFMHVDPAGSGGLGTWTSLLNEPPEGIGPGGDMVTDGTDIYAWRGGETTEFYKYTITNNATGAGTWSVLDEVPNVVGEPICGTPPCISYDGGGLTFYNNGGTPEIWGATGNGWGGTTQQFSLAEKDQGGLIFRYDITTDEWPHIVSPANTPSNVSFGGSIAYPGSGDYVYAFRGDNTPEYWAYDTVNNNWRAKTIPKFDTDVALSQDNGDHNWDNGNKIVDVNGEIFVLSGGTADEQLLKFNPGTNTWTTLATPPTNLGAGTSITKTDNNTLYIGTGNSTDFFKYDIPSDTWFSFNMGEFNSTTAIPQMTVGQDDGSSIAEYNGEFYVVPGYGTNEFMKYNPTTNTWTDLTPCPISYSDGASIVFVEDTVTPANNAFYVLRGSSYNFYRYDIAGDSWTTLTNSTVYPYEGGDMTFSDASGSPTIYATRGGGNTTFYAYTITDLSTGAGSWATLAAAPNAFRGGGGITTLSSSGNEIYALHGDTYDYFSVYDITGGTWNSGITNPPRTITCGGALTSDGTYIYASGGYDSSSTTSSSFMKYDPVGDEWGYLAPTPARMCDTSSDYYEQGGVVYYDDGGTGEIWMIPGYAQANSLPTNAGSLFKYDIATDNWPIHEKTASAPWTLAAGSSLAYPAGGNNIFGFRGSNSTSFASYDFTRNQWHSKTNAIIDDGATSGDTLTQTSTTRGYGATSTVMGGKVYILAGSNTPTFESYDPINDEWKTLANIPYNAYNGAAMTNDGTYIYAMPGYYQSYSYRYDPSRNIWEQMGNMPSTIYTGGAMTYPGGNYIYALRGYNSTSFYKYDITQPLPGTWQTASTAVPSTVYAGGALTSVGGDIYAFRGYNSSTFYKFTVTNSPAAGDGTWSTLTSPTWTSSNHVAGGGSLTTDGTDIYASKGYADPDIKKYTVGTDTWSDLANFPVDIGYASTSSTRGGIVYVATGPSGGGELYGIAGYSGPTSTAASIYRYPFTGVNAGTWPTLAAHSAPTCNIYGGGSLTGLKTSLNNYFLYALCGGNSSNGLKYAISDINTGAGTWSSETYSLGNVTSGGSLTSDSSSDRVYAASGNERDVVNQYNVNPTTGVLGVPTSLASSPVDVGSTSTSEARGALTYSPTLDELYLSSGYGTFGSEYGDALLYRYPFTGINAGTWPITAAGPAAIPSGEIYYGANLEYVPGANGGIYATRGDNTTSFWKYTPSTGILDPGSWDTLTSLPWAAYEGTRITANDAGTALWAVQGNDQTGFARYDITGPTTGTWTTALSQMPFNAAEYDSGGLDFYNNELWYAPGEGTTYYDDDNTTLDGLLGMIYRYDITGDEWPIFYEAADLPTTSDNVADGSDLVESSDGSTIYALRGYLGTIDAAHPNFWSYTISSTGKGTWNQETNITKGGSNVQVGSGGSLQRVGDLLFATVGNNTGNYFSYDTVGGTWTEREAVPVNMGLQGSYDAGDIAYVPAFGSMYALPGNDTTAPYTIYTYPVIRAAIENVEKTGGGTPVAGESMDITVRVLDEEDNFYNVSANTDIQIGVDTGSGTVGGTITGTINSGTSSVVISGLTYSTPDSGVVLSATDITSPANTLTLGSSLSDPFQVLAGTLTVSGITESSGPTAGTTGFTVNGTNFYNHYYKSITIDNNDATLYTDVPIDITFDSASLISEGKMRSDCGDVRFTSSVATLPYSAAVTNLDYVMGTCNSFSSTATVKVPSLPASGSTTIYLNYGDNSLADNSDPDNVYDFADTFDGSTIDPVKWDTTYIGSYITQNDALYVSNSTYSYYGLFTNRTDFLRSNNLTAEFDFKPTTTNYSYDLITGWRDTTTNLGYQNAAIGNGGWYHGMNSNSTNSDDVWEAGSSYSAGQSWTLNQQYKIRITMKSGNGALYERSTDGGSNWVTWLDNSTQSNTNARFGIFAYQQQGIIDNLYIKTGTTTAPTVTINNDETPTLTVDIDTAGATVLNVAPTAIKAVTTAHSAGGPYNVVVTNSYNSADTLATAFTYNLPNIASIYPNKGPGSGGQTVDLTGTDFTPEYYIQPIELDNTGGGLLTDFQIPFSLDSETLMNSGQMRTDMGDIRLYEDVDLTTPINNFWVEGPTYDTLSKIWVKVPSIAASTVETIYATYGDLTLTMPAGATIANTFAAVTDAPSNYGYWSMDEATGTATIDDSSYYDNNGTMQGTGSTTNVITGQRGNGRSFNGTDNYIDAPVDETFYNGTSGISAEAWVKFDTTSYDYQAVVAKYPNNVNDCNGGTGISGFDFNIYNRQIRFYIYANNTSDYVYYSTQLNTGQWYHLVGTFDDATNTGKIYVDGSPVATDTGMSGVDVESNDANVRIGSKSDYCNTQGDMLTGELDEVRIYDRALTDSEVSNLYNYQGYATPEAPGYIMMRNTDPQPTISNGTAIGFADVTFDSIAADAIVDATRTLIQAVTPTHADGVISVVLTNLDSQTANINYEYGTLTTDAGNSTVTVDTSNVEADGVEIGTVTVSLLDSSTIPNPVPDKTVVLTQTAEPVGGTTTITAIDCPAPEPAGSSPGVSNVNGKACFTVSTLPASTAGVTGTYTFQAEDTTDSITVTDTENIDFIELITDPSPSTLTVAGGTAVADGVDVKTPTLTLLNQNSVAVPSRSVELNQQSGPGTLAFNPDPGTTDASGQETFDITTTTAGTYTVMATDIGGVPNVDINDLVDIISVDFVAGPPDPTTSTVIETSTGPYLANGADTLSITVTLQDQYGNLDLNHTVDLTQFSGPAGGSTISPVNTGDCAGNPNPAGNTDDDGEACFEVTTLIAGTYEFEAEDTTDSVTINQKPSISFTGPTAANSTVVEATGTAIANGYDTDKITVTMLDASANTFPSRSITLSKSAGTGTTAIDAINCSTDVSLGGGATADTDSNGQVCFAVSSPDKETFTYEAYNNTETFTVTDTADVTFDDGIAWTTGGEVIANAKIDNSTYYWTDTKVVKTSDGNYITVWRDNREATGKYNIYAQKFNSSGVPQWAPTTTGVLVWDASGSTYPSNHFLVEPSDTGAIITWPVGTSLVAQRIDSTGSTTWTSPYLTVEDPVRISSGSNETGWGMKADGTNGVFIAYRDNDPADTDHNITVTRLNSSGSVVSPDNETWPVRLADNNRSCSSEAEVDMEVPTPGVLYIAYMEVRDNNCGTTGTRENIRVSSLNTSDPNYTIGFGSVSVTTANATTDGVSGGNQCPLDSINHYPMWQHSWDLILDSSTNGVYIIFEENCARYVNDDERVYINHIGTQSSGNGQWSLQLTPLWENSNDSSILTGSTDYNGNAIVGYKSYWLDEPVHNFHLDSYGHNAVGDSPIINWKKTPSDGITMGFTNSQFQVSVDPATGDPLIVWNDGLYDTRLYGTKYVGSTGALFSGWNGNILSENLGVDYFIDYAIRHVQNIVPDGSGGFVLAGDHDNHGFLGYPTISDEDNYIQRVNTNGVAQWNTPIGVEISPGVDIYSAAEKTQTNQKIVRVSPTEFIAAWEDNAGVTFNDPADMYRIRAEKFTLAGVREWEPDNPGFGIWISDWSSDFDNDDMHHDSVSIAADDDGGLTGGFITLYRKYDPLATLTDRIWVQKTDTAGDHNTTWSSNEKGRQVAAVTAGQIPQNQTAIVSDGAGGAYIAWTQGTEIYGQQIDGTTGVINASWNGSAGRNLTNGVGTFEFTNPILLHNSSNELFLVADFYNTGTTGKSVRIHKLNTTNGSTTSLTYATLTEADVTLNDATLDNSGNVLISWTNNDTNRVYAQKLDRTALAKQWGNNGLEVSTGSNDQDSTIASDNNGGAIVAWEKHNGDPGTASDIAIQRIDSTGNLLWNEKILTDESSVVYKTNPEIDENGITGAYPSNGAILTWQVWDAGMTNSSVITQHVINAVEQWGTYGTSLASSINENPVIMTDENSGATVAWEKQVGGLPDIYGQYNAEGDHAFNSTLVADKNLADADGIDVVTLKATILDSTDTAISNQQIQIDTIFGSSTGIVITPVNTGDCAGNPNAAGYTDTQGEACFEVTATVGGVRTFAGTNLTDGATITGTETVTFIGLADPGLSSLSASDPNVVADGVVNSTITATVLDNGSTPLLGKVVTLANTAGPGTPTIKAVNCDQADVGSITKGTTNASGEACFNVHSTTITSPGAETFQATVVTDSVVITQTADVEFEDDLPDLDHSTFVSAPGSVTADGATASTLTATILDSLNRTIVGETVNVTDDSGGNVDYTPVSQSEVTNGSGVADFDVVSTVAGLYTFTSAIQNLDYYNKTSYGVVTSPTFVNDYEGTAATLIAGSVGDDVEATTTLPFDFELYGTNVTNGTNIYVCSNGFISLASTGCPSIESPSLSNAIGGFVTNLDTTNGGIYREVATDGNSVRFLWDAEEVPSTDPIFFEIILHRNNQVEMHYFVNSGYTARIGLYDSTAGSVPDDASPFDNAVFANTSASKFRNPPSASPADVVETAQVDFTAGAVSAGNSSIVAVPPSVEADGTTASTITVTLRDSFNNPVPSRLVEITDDGAPAQVTYNSPPVPHNQATTDGSGEANFDVTSTTIATVTFTGTDITGAPLTIGTTQVDFTCILDPNQQCVQVEIEPGAGVLTITAPDDFAFPTTSSSMADQDIFSIDSATPYTLNTNDVLVVTDTENNGGFTVQLQASTSFQDPISLDTIPLTSLYGITQASSTGGTTFPAPYDGVEYDLGYAGVTNITSTQNNDTAGSLNSATTFTTNGDNLDTAIDLMIGPVTSIEGGRNGQFKQNVQYYLLIPGGQETGNYEVTLTFDLTRTAPI